MTKYLFHTKISKFWILVVLIIMAFPLLKVIHPILRSQSFMLLFLFFSPSDKVDIQCLGVNPKFYLTNAHVQNLGLRTSGAQIFIFNCFRFSLVFINFYLNMFFVFFPKLPSSFMRHMALLLITLLSMALPSRFLSCRTEILAFSSPLFNVSLSGSPILTPHRCGSSSSHI